MKDAPKHKQPKNLATGDVPIEIDLTRTEAAWKRHAARARALDALEVNPARVDVTLAAAIAVAGARNVLGERERLVSTFRHPPIDVLERVEDVAHAAQHADLLARAAQDADAPFADILPRMNELRGLFVDDLAVQVRRRRVPEHVLDAIRAGDNSVRDKANDLNDCAGYYRAHWDVISAKTTIEPAEIAEATELAAKALARIGKARVPGAPREGELAPLELRRRAFTLLLRDYGVVRRYGAFLFFDLPEGWESFVPTLWTARQPPTRSEISPMGPPAPPNAPPAPPAPSPSH